MHARRIDASVDDGGLPGTSAVDPFAALVEEQELISRVAGGLSSWAGRIQHGEEDGKLELCRFVGFFRHFVCNLHFAKEAAVVHGPAVLLLGVLPRLEEIEAKQSECRSSIASLHHLATLHRAWVPAERRRLVVVAEELARALKASFALERDVVFPHLRGALSVERCADLARRLARYEAEHAGRGEHERHLAMATALAAWSGPRLAGDA